MYIDEKLIKILEPHRGEEIDVSYAIGLIRTIAKEYETQQLKLCEVSESLRMEELLMFYSKHPTFNFNSSIVEVLSALNAR